MTKSELKSIIKECLVEILSDGLGESLNEVNQRKKAAASLVEKKEHEKRMIQRKRQIADAVSMTTNDPILKSVLEHTAKTTLKDQMNNEIRPPRLSESYDDDNSSFGGSSDPGLNIDQLFGGASKNWAAAAFSQKKIP